MASLGDPQVRQIVVYHVVNAGKTALTPARIFRGDPVIPPVRRISPYEADAVIYDPKVLLSGVVQHLVNLDLLPAGSKVDSVAYLPAYNAFSMHVKHAHDPRVVTSRATTLWERVSNALTSDEWKIEAYL